MLALHLAVRKKAEYQRHSTNANCLNKHLCDLRTSHVQVLKTTTNDHIYMLLLLQLDEEASLCINKGVHPHMCLY